MSVASVLRRVRSPASGAPAGREAELLAVILGVLLAIAALRRYYPLAAPDYNAEIIPALQGLRTDGLVGWIEALPGYPAAAMLELPVLAFGELLGLSDANSWRLLSTVAIGVLVVAVISALPLLRAARASRTATLVAIALTVGTPTAYWALRIGHPEEVFSTGLLLGAVIAAAAQRPLLAGVLLGCAAGKGWAVAAALPVLGLLLPDWRRVMIAVASAAVVALALFLPALVVERSSVQVMALTGSAHIFNAGQIYWWFGDPIALSAVAEQSVPQPRIGPKWTGLISHPLIVGIGTSAGLVWCLTIHQRLGELGLLGRDASRQLRSLAARADLASSALLVMAAILLARCYLDTWNVPYYILPALVCGAIGEAMRGRVPVIALVATAMMWKYHPPSDPTIRTEPDVYTATYLAWIIPFSVGYLLMGLQAARTALVAPAAPATPADATTPDPQHSAQVH